MRPVRDDALAVLENAAIRLSALNAADASKAQPWLSELDENLARRLASTKRMRARIFGGLVSDAGDPADLSNPVRRLLSLTPEARRTTAIGAGLAYHIASLGPAMARETIEALAVIFGREVVSFALANSYLVAAAPLPSRQLDDQYPGIVEADGWAILRLLASGHGLGSVWQAGWGKGCDSGSVTLHRLSVEAIGAVVLTQLSAVDGDENMPYGGRVQ